MTDLILQDLRDLFGEHLALVLCCEKLKMFGGQKLQEKKEGRQPAGFKAVCRSNANVRKPRRKKW